MNNKISRKEAIQKLGKYGKFTALTAFGTFAILNPQMAQAFSDQGPFGNERFNPNGKNGSGIWGSDKRYNRSKNEGFRVPFSNDTQYGPFHSGGASTPFSGGIDTPPSGNSTWK